MDMISIIQQYKPEQVLIWRLFLPEVNEYLSKHYNPVYTIDGKGLWIRDDIRKIPSQ